MSDAAVVDEYQANDVVMSGQGSHPVAIATGKELSIRLFERLQV